MKAPRRSHRGAEVQLAERKAGLANQALDRLNQHLDASKGQVGPDRHLR